MIKINFLPVEIQFEHEVERLVHHCQAHMGIVGGHEEAIERFISYNKSDAEYLRGWFRKQGYCFLSSRRGISLLFRKYAPSD